MGDYQKIIKNIVLLLSGEKKRLLKKLKKENPKQAKALKHLQDVSLVTREPSNTKEVNRIEGYDISHLAGKEVYGAMAVFENGRPKKEDYRLFKIREEKNNDLRALEEMLLRRFNHKEWPWPDLILIDGGRPQISHLAPRLKVLNIAIPVIGISKFGGDKLVFPKDTKKSAKELAASVKRILLAVRDEAHRFGLKASRGRRRIR